MPRILVFFLLIFSVRLCKRRFFSDRNVPSALQKASAPAPGARKLPMNLVLHSSSVVWCYTKIIYYVFNWRDVAGITLVSLAEMATKLFLFRFLFCIHTKYHIFKFVSVQNIFFSKKFWFFMRRQFKRAAYRYFPHKTIFFHLTLHRFCFPPAICQNLRLTHPFWLYFCPFWYLFFTFSSNFRFFYILSFLILIFFPSNVIFLIITPLLFSLSKTYEVYTVLNLLIFSVQKCEANLTQPNITLRALDLFSDVLRFLLRTLLAKILCLDC